MRPRAPQKGSVAAQISEAIHRDRVGALVASARDLVAEGHRVVIYVDPEDKVDPRWVELAEDNPTRVEIVANAIGQQTYNDGIAR